MAPISLFHDCHSFSEVMNCPCAAADRYFVKLALLRWIYMKSEVSRLTICVFICYDTVSLMLDRLSHFHCQLSYQLSFNLLIYSNIWEYASQCISSFLNPSHPLYFQSPFHPSISLPFHSNPHKITNIILHPPT
jgi:hypothetical protein